MSDVYLVPAEHYRVVDRDGGFEPQMQYPINGSMTWLALDRAGCWAEPDDWNIVHRGGQPVGRNVLSSRSEADAAVAKARRVNGDLPKAV